MILIIPKLWIGSIDNATSDSLISHGIHTVLNVSGIPIDNQIPGIRYIDIPIKRKWNMNINSDIFHVTNYTIDCFLDGGILVNCKKGKHRSACVIMAHLMSKYNMSIRDAFYYLKSKKKDVLTSSIYMLHELKKYSNELKKYSNELKKCFTTN